MRVPAHRALVPRTAAWLAAGLLAATPVLAEGRPPARADAFVARLAGAGQGVAIDAAGRSLPLGADQLRHYARFLALDPDANPPTLKVWMKLDPAARPAIAALGATFEGS